MSELLNNNEALSIRLKNIYSKAIVSTIEFSKLLQLLQGCMLEAEEVMEGKNKMSKEGIIKKDEGTNGDKSSIEPGL